MKRLALGIGILFLSLLMAACGPTPAPSPVPPTLTPLPTATAVPTATPQPTADPMQGWEKFAADGVELWLPESYEGGDLAAAKEQILAGMRRLGPEYDQMAEYIEQNPSAFVIYAYDPEGETSGMLSATIVTKQQSAMTLDAYLDSALDVLPEQCEVLERGIAALGDLQAGRVVLSWSLSGASFKELMYIIKDSGTIWTLTYGTGAVKFEVRLPVFERSASTFRLQP